MAFASLDRALNSIAEACLDRRKWTGALASVAQETNSTGALLVPAKGRLPNDLCSESLRDAHHSYIRDGWIKRDERYRGLPVCLRTGAVTDTDFALIDEIDRHPYWQEWLRSYGLKWFAGVLIGFGDDRWVLSIQRSEAEGRFSPEEMHSLAKLSPKLSAHGAFAHALGHAELEAAAAAFEASRTAVLLFNRLGQVTHVNPSAERLLDQDIRIQSQRLTSSDPSAAMEIDRALRATLLSLSGNEAKAIVKLPRRNRKPVIGYLMRAPGICSDALTPCQAIMTLIDPEASISINERVLREAFDLTPTEAHVAAKASGQMELRDIAGELGISYETARTHLKSIFAKLGVGRQAELSTLLSSLGRLSSGK